MALALTLAAAALAGCPITDPSRPIGLVPAPDLSSADVAALFDGSECWNLAFGVDFRSGDDARGAEQQVEVFFDDFSCADRATARVLAGWPMSIGLCRLRWGEVESFLIFAHELGHVLNIVGHPEGARTMGYDANTGIGQAMFNDVDRAAFADANRGFTVTPACPRVERTYDPDDFRPVCGCTDP